MEHQLYRSPYSGCCKFSGWKETPPQARPMPWVPARASCSPGTILCVDKYNPNRTKGVPYWNDLTYQSGPPRATVTVFQPAYNLRPIAGPSATGPFTVRRDNQTFGVSGLGGAGHNQGLT